MATRKENIKALFQNTRTRIIIILTALVLLITMVIGFFKFGVATEVSSSDKLKRAPGGIQSIPGKQDQTAQYAALQEIQNVEQAKQAEKSGSSAIPTIIRTQAFGEGVELISPPSGEGGIGFVTLSQADEGGPQRSLWIDSLKKEKCNVDTVKRVVEQGAMLNDLKEGCTCLQLKEAGYTLRDLLNVCTCLELKNAGYSAINMKAVDFTLEKLRQCGFSACEVRGADYSAKQMASAGFTEGELKGAGFPEGEIQKALNLSDTLTDEIRKAGCDPVELAKLRKKGVTAEQIIKMNGCDAAALRAAGFPAENLAGAGFGTKGIPGVKDCSVASLKAARAAGISAKTIRETLGCSAAALKAAGFTDQELRDAGYSDAELKAAGILPKTIAAAPLKDALPAIPSFSKSAGRLQKAKTTDLDKINEIKNRQESQAMEQRYQNKIKQRSGTMVNAAKQLLKRWEDVATQVYVSGKVEEAKEEGVVGGAEGTVTEGASAEEMMAAQAAKGPMVIKTGDILFAVLDTSVNSDEPGPILATIVSGRLKGSKLIGSFNLPSNAEKMVITFNTLSMPGIDKTISVNAYAIDPDTARTALSSRTNHHYLMRYGALFASTFMAGFSTAIQSADTTVSIGGTGGTTTTTVQNGIDRSALDNALIGLGAVGQAWAQTAQQNMNRPTTVEVFSGTGMGILFTQDVTLG